MAGPSAECTEIQTGLEVTTQDNTTKTKLEVTLKKSDKFDALYEAQQAQQAAAAAAAATTEAAA